MRLRVLITGSRSWDDEETIRTALTDVGLGNNPGSITLVHGDARGADRTAAKIARELGWHVEAHRADWDRWGRQAGYIRNVAMVGSRVDLCLAFIVDGSAGASHCADMAEQRDIPTRRFTRTTVTA